MAKRHRPDDWPAASDHAVLAYLERVWNVDIDGLRHRIERVATVAVACEAEAVVRRGVRYVVRHGVVTDVGLKRRPRQRPERERP